jgi:hypothetical protein
VAVVLTPAAAALLIPVATHIDFLSQVHSSFIPRAPIISGPLAFFERAIFLTAPEISRTPKKSHAVIFLETKLIAR